MVLWPQPAQVLVVLRCSCLAAEMLFGSVVKTRWLIARTYLVQRKRKSDITRVKLGVWSVFLGYSNKREKAPSFEHEDGGHGRL